MVDKTNEGSGVQGTPPTISQIREYLKRDLSVSINLLEAIYRDENTMNAVADYLHGRLLNSLQAQALKNQTELDLNGKRN